MSEGRLYGLRVDDKSDFDEQVTLLFGGDEYMAELFARHASGLLDDEEEDFWGRFSGMNSSVLDDCSSVAPSSPSLSGAVGSLSDSASRFFEDAVGLEKGAPGWTEAVMGLVLSPGRIEKIVRYFLSPEQRAFFERAARGGSLLLPFADAVDVVRPLLFYGLVFPFKEGGSYRFVVPDEVRGRFLGAGGGLEPDFEFGDRFEKFVLFCSNFYGYMRVSDFVRLFRTAVRRDFAKEPGFVGDVDAMPDDFIADLLPVLALGADAGAGWFSVAGGLLLDDFYGRPGLPLLEKNAKRLSECLERDPDVPYRLPEGLPFSGLLGSSAWTGDVCGELVSFMARLTIDEGVCAYEEDRRRSDLESFAACVSKSLSAGTPVQIVAGDVARELGCFLGRRDGDALLRILGALRGRVPLWGLRGHCEKDFASLGRLRGGDAPASSARIGPNEPCICGSGKKYKKCCGKGG